MPTYALKATELFDSQGRPYAAWEIPVPRMLLILTTAELRRAQGRGEAQEARQRVQAQSVANEVAAFDKAYALKATELFDSHGHPYTAWEIPVPERLLVLTTAELDRAQARGKAQETRQRVQAQSVANEVAAFDKAYVIE